MSLMPCLCRVCFANVALCCANVLCGAYVAYAVPRSLMLCPCRVCCANVALCRANVVSCGAYVAYAVRMSRMLRLCRVCCACVVYAAPVSFMLRLYSLCCACIAYAVATFVVVEQSKAVRVVMAEVNAAEHWTVFSQQFDEDLVVVRTKPVLRSVLFELSWRHVRDQNDLWTYTHEKINHLLHLQHTHT